MKKIAIFASGNGSNAENIYKFFANGNRVRVALVIYDRPGARVAERMAAYPDVKTLYIPKSVWAENPQEILDLLREEGIDMVVLAGFLRFVPQELTEAYAGRMLNIHPSLVPAYSGPGMYGDKIHQAVIAAGETKSGVTVHYVSDVVDGGEILMQEEVEVAADDTPESLAEKIHAVEYSLYPRAIVKALGRIESPSADNINEPMLPPAVEGITPPPLREPAEEWAETLGVSYDPEKVAVATGKYAGEGDDEDRTGTSEDIKDRSVNAMASGTGLNNRPPRPHVDEGMPPTYLVWAVVMTVLCCLPAGVVAIVFACQVSSKFYAGDMEGALRASERAQIWIIVSFVLGVLANTLSLPIMLLF